MSYLLCLTQRLPTSGQPNNGIRQDNTCSGDGSQNGMNRDRLEEVRRGHLRGLVHTGLSPSGVPGIGTSAFTGKDSGCSSKLGKVRVCHSELVSPYLETSQIKPIRSSSFSPSPKMPPLQTLMPAVRTASMVARRSSYVRVVITYHAVSLPHYNYSMPGYADLWIELSTGIQIMVIGGEPRLFELFGFFHC